ncbi:MAG: serine/threonine protein kinase [Kiritimatiellae bacterium]|nr:serine/threonine protein kinase [Kiritimatiellia bacterium]
MDEDSISAMCAAHGPVASACRFAAGTIFGDWRLTAFIGRGGNGEVYCAEHVSLGTSAALKVLARDEPRAKERFVREAKLLSELKSTSFPQFYSYGEANGCTYLAMELLEPGDLPAGDRNVARFLLSVCDAVAELHSRGYIHRDIKPSNILWRTGTTGGSPVAVPVLADLGLVKSITTSDGRRSTSDITLGGVGTPGYGAPEQMERGEATVASDIHALGVLADACFRGNPPRTWARIIRRATSSIPAHRYPSVVAFARAIRRRNLLLGVSAFVAVIALSGLCLSCFYSWWTQSGREVWRWRALCDYGEIVSVSRICEPLDESHPKYPGSIVRYVTNRVDGTILNLPKDTLSFAKPILLKPGEYRIVGPGRLDADLSGPSNAVVRLKDCVVNNTTSVPYPQNGIHYVLEGGAYLNFVNLDRNIEHRRYIHSDGKSRNALRFRGPMTFKELDEEQACEYERMLMRDLR